MTNKRPIILSHESALAFWRKPDAAIKRALDSQEAQRAMLETGPASHVKSLRELLTSPALVGIPLPLNLLTSERDERRITKRMHLHCVQSSFPGKAFYEISGATARVIVSSPELCFVQMATKLTFPELVLLGFELCGSYSAAPQELRGFIKSKAVTSPEQIQAFAL